MAFLRLPSTLRWVLVASFIMLIMMSLYRIILVWIFKSETTQEGFVMVAGLAQDAGIVSIIGLVAIGIGSLSVFHPYKSKSGKIVMLSYFSATAMLLTLVYIFDIIFLKSLDTRISSDVFLLFSEGKEKALTILNRNFKILPIFLFVLSVGAMWWLLLNWLFYVLGMLERVRQKRIRFQWQTITIGVFTIFILTSFISTKNVTKKDLKMGSIGTKALIWNPVQTVTEH